MGTTSPYVGGAMLTPWPAVRAGLSSTAIPAPSRLLDHEFGLPDDLPGQRTGIEGHLYAVRPRR